MHDIGVELPEGAPGTESGDLAVALNRMLGQIEGALAEQQGSEDRLRRFFADAAHARQVIANVVGNALVHTDPDVPVAIAVSSTADRVSVEVRDAGGGMSSEVTTRVTERFYRADPARSRHRGGSGLGLSIVDAAVSAHGGSVTIDSRPGAGTDVRLDFPRIERSIHTGSDAATDTDADVDRSTAGNS